VLVSDNTLGAPYPFQAVTDTCALNLFLDAQYTIRAHPICQPGRKARADRNAVTVGGQDLSTSNVTLTFAASECSRPQPAPDWQSHAFKFRLTLCFD
jgi:hypothetical protein